MFSNILCVISVIFAVIVATIYHLSKRKYDYWKKQKVPHPAPAAIVGNYGELLFLKKHIAYIIDAICKQFPHEPYVGAYYGTGPTLIVKDPEYIKLITTRDFYYFNGRETSAYVHKELFTRNLFNNNGDEWRVVRQSLTPVFTSAKMRNMFHLIEKCSYELENLLDAQYEISSTIETRKLVVRFTMACIVSCAFGVDSDTMGEGYKENPFTKAGESFFNQSSYLMVKRHSKSMWPGIFYALGLKVFPPQVNGFFKNFMVSIFEARQYKPTSRNDFVDFILNFKQNDYLIGDSITNLKTGEDKKVKLPLTDELLLSQCLVFFLAGFETSATTTTYTLYQLAQHPEVQKKVQEEIDAYLVKYQNKLTYDIVNELPFTYACVEETLRMYPVVPHIAREVIEDYKLPTGVFLEKGTRIHIPVYHLHWDPKYFPEPEIYRPERFLGKEKRKITPYSYIPFGEGSRICIGMRFAKMQVLAGLVTLLKKYDIELDENCPRELKIDPSYIIPTPTVPLTMKIKPREGWESRLLAKK